jgi:hypothetical protein
VKIIKQIKNHQEKGEGRREKEEMKFKNNIFLLSLTAVFLVGPQGWGMKQTDDKMVEVKCPFFLNPNNLKLYVLQINQKDLPNYKFTPINDSYYVLIKLNDDQTIPKISPLGKANFYYVDNNEIPLTQGLFCWYNKIHYKASHPDKRFDETPNPKIVHPSKSLYGTIKPPEEQSPPSSPKQKNLSPKIPETNIFKNTIQKLKNTLASLAEKIRGGEGGKKKK